MASGQPAHRQPRTFERAMFDHGLPCVLRARGDESARTRKHLRQNDFIGSQQGQRDPLGSRKALIRHPGEVHSFLRRESPRDNAFR